MKIAFWLVTLALPLAAQPKKLVNAALDSRAVTGTLEDEFRALQALQPQPAWIAYSVPAARTRNFGCDSNWRDGQTTIAGGTVHLEPAADIMLLFRVENGQVGRVRSLALDCDIDAGGVPFHWLTAVKPAASVALLERFVKSDERMGDAALSAIAYHADTSADAVLESFVRPDQPEWLRRKAVHYVGTARGRHGFEVLRKVLAEDTSVNVRERAVQSLSQSTEPQSLDLLLSLAREDRSARIRGQAILSLGQRGGPKAVAAVTNAINTDSDQEVQRRAVSALRMLPNGEGVPLLIQLAKTNRDREVRKQAMSALAQTRDPQALAFFEQVLNAR